MNLSLDKVCIAGAIMRLLFDQLIIGKLKGDTR